MTLAEKAALDDLAQHLYPFLPGKPHPYADARISFEGVARELGLADCWSGSSKQPAIRQLLGATIDGKRGFPSLILKVVERGMTYRKNKNPIVREDIERLNQLLAGVGYKIPDLHDAAFLEKLPRGGKPMQANDKGTPPDSKSLSELQDRVLKLSVLKSQERGYAFEGFLSELFSLYKLAPRGAFRLTGEQIDGSFHLKSESYLLEAKWQDARVGLAELLTFNGKVEGKAQWSRGLFVSYCGFSDEGLQAFAQGRRTNICMDGLDLAHVLSGRIDFKEAVERKARRAAETNRAFVPVRDLFSSVI